MRPFHEYAPGVFVATSELDSATTTVLVSGDRALLVDPNWTMDELTETADWLRGRGLTVAAGFATHAHHDHVLWHPAFGPAPRWASPTVGARATAHRAALAAELEPLGFPPQLADLVGRLDAFDGARLPWPTRVELVRHDAHSPGHTALWLPDRRVLIAGDMLSDAEPPLPEDTGLDDYRRGLDILRPYVERAEIVIPGHGTVGTDALGRWAADLAALDAL